MQKAQPKPFRKGSQGPCCFLYRRAGSTTVPVESFLRVFNCLLSNSVGFKSRMVSAGALTLLVKPLGPSGNAESKAASCIQGWNPLLEQPTCPLPHPRPSPTSGCRWMVCAVALPEALRVSVPGLSVCYHEY